MKELLLSVTKADLRIETKRGTGPGGQHRNKTESAVRIVHIATGLSAESDETRSQHQNKKLAFRRLCTMLVAHYFPERQKARQPGGTEIVRTYHAVENRVVDAASGARQSFDGVLDGSALDGLMAARAHVVRSAYTQRFSGRVTGEKVTQAPDANASHRTDGT